MVAEKQAKHSQRLWSACQSLILNIQSGTNTKPWEEQLKPLENEVSLISAAAGTQIFSFQFVNVSYVFPKNDILCFN